jgi:DtxR family Mn-dependent transcriptional regulator
VHDDAEVLEHHVSDRVLAAIERLAGYPAEDPHGHLIPDRRGRLRPRRLEPLAQLGAGSRAVVREIRDADTARLARWKEMGLVPGAPVRVLEVRPLDGVLVLDVAGRRRISSGVALEGILVGRGATR